jgi:hypothetical protein
MDDGPHLAYYGKRLIEYITPKHCEEWLGLGSVSDPERGIQQSYAADFETATYENRRHQPARYKGGNPNASIEHCMLWPDRCIMYI